MPVDHDWCRPLAVEPEQGISNSGVGSSWSLLTPVNRRLAVNALSNFLRQCLVTYRGSDPKTKISVGARPARLSPRRQTTGHRAPRPQLMPTRLRRAVPACLHPSYNFARTQDVLRLSSRRRTHYTHRATTSLSDYRLRFAAVMTGNPVRVRVRGVEEIASCGTVGVQHCE